MNEEISKTLESMGIKTKDEEGNCLPNEKIIANFQEQFESFSQDQKIITIFVIAYFKNKYMF